MRGWLDSFSTAGLKRLGRLLTPGRVVTGAIVLLVVATLWQSWSVYRYKTALAVLNAAARRGFSALEAGRFEQAAKLLDQAARAGRTVGTSSATARRAIHLAREASIWSHLATSQLDEFFATHSLADAERTIAAFNDSFSDRTAIFDARLVTAQGEPAVPGKPPRYHLDWTWFEHGQRIEIEVGQALELGFAGRESKRVLFGAQIQGLERPASGNAPWRLRLKPETVTLLTASGPLRGSHWPDELSWTMVLAEQRKRLDLGE
jgi:hypothetical protein